MDYIKILETAIEASNNRDTVLKTVESNLKNFQKTLANVNG